MSTTTSNETVKSALDKGDPNKLGDLVATMKLGTMLTPISTTVTQAAAATITLSPPARAIRSVRVTAGAAAAGIRAIGDVASTPSATLVRMSLDGATLTFEANVTGAIVVYEPASNVSMASDFPTTGLG